MIQLFEQLLREREMVLAIRDKYVLKIKTSILSVVIYGVYVHLLAVYGVYVHNDYLLFMCIYCTKRNNNNNEK